MLGRLIRRGGQDDAVWDEISELLEQRRRLVDSERRRLVEMRQMITVEQLLALLAQTQQVILEHVSDRQVRARLSAEFKRLVLVDSGERT